MTMKKIQNDYDQIKGFLNKIRKIQETTNPEYGMIQEQEDSRGPLTAPYGYGAGTKKPIPRSVNNPSVEDDPVQDPTIKDIPGEEGEEQKDIAVINNVDIQIHSSDPEDLELKDEEKNRISQLIDDFRTEISEIAEFEGLHIYPESAKLNGVIKDVGINFVLSTGDDTGLYISNPSLLKIENDSIDIIGKLRSFLPKYSNTINNLLLDRSHT